MGRRRFERVLINRATVDRRAGAEIRRVPDELIVEEPLTVQVNGQPVTTTMRTPGHDFELAVGWCHAEGLLAGGRPRSIQYCSSTTTASETEYNVVNVALDAAVSPAARLVMTSSSCGWCGSDQIEDLLARIDVLPQSEPIPLPVLAAIPDSVRQHQELFDLTGGVHAAAAFEPDGGVTVVREDVGRHNAVDKVVGALLVADRLPAVGRGLFVSGRASVEIVQKAWAAGFSTVVAVSAPTSLAVAAARRANLWLAGFGRGDRINIYAPERPTGGPTGSDSS